MQVFSSFIASSLLLALFATGCTNLPPDCGCDCPAPRSIEPASYSAEKVTAPAQENSTTPSSSPHVGGRSFVLEVSEDKQTFRLSYEKAGKPFVETWRVRP